MNREEILDRARHKQNYESTEVVSAGAGPSLRIILEFDDDRKPSEVIAQVRQKLGLDVEAVRLFEPVEGGEADDSLRGFIAVSVPRVDLEAIDGQAFELGYAIADATGAATAEPELGTDFFVEPPTSLESAGDLLGCWTPDSGDITTSQPYWAVDCIKARAAWGVAPAAGGTARGEGISVFQPDTGVADHVELESGAVDQPRAYDFVDNRPGAIDPLGYSGNPGHGTGTASVVASRDGGAMVGSAPRATLVPVRAIEKVVVFDHGKVAAAVEHARRGGANVITMSLGGAWSSALRAAIRRAIADGVIVLAAAGNCVRSVVWPARYEEVIAVAGTDVNDKPWRGTCSGDAVDVSAPGEFVPRAKRNPQDGGGPNVVAGGQGTSFAVALTAGVAALWVGHHTVGRVKSAAGSGSVQSLFVSLLRSTARQPPGFDTTSMGAGIVDAEAVLRHALVSHEAVAETVETETYHSLHTLIAETGDAEAAVRSIDQRRFAAELSHLALEKQKYSPRRGLETIQVETRTAQASPTLRRAVIPSAGQGLEAIVGR